MVDIPTAIERRLNKPKLNVNAPPFIPFSTPTPLSGHSSKSTVRSTSPNNEATTVMSYSAALKNARPKLKPAIPAVSSVSPVTEIGSVPLEKVVEPSTGPRQQATTAPSKRKPTKEIPLGDFLQKLADQEKSTNASKGNQGPKTNFKQGGNVAKSRGPQKEGNKGEKQTTAAAVPRGNILDSSVPVLHKGKQRENPKKKYSRMKKAVLSERKQRQEGQPGQEDSPTEDTSKEHQDNDTCCSLETPTSNEEMPSATSRSQPLKKSARPVSKFRDNVLSAELDKHVIAVINMLGRFQDRLYAEDPEKARKKKRIVYGLREVHKFLTVEKIKCVILAPNIESASGSGGLDEMINDILKMCREQNVPYFFALTKMKLGYVSHKHTPVSCAGILNFQGADAQYKTMLESVGQAKEAFAASSETPVQQVEAENFERLFI